MVGERDWRARRQMARAPNSKLYFFFLWIMISDQEKLCAACIKIGNCLVYNFFFFCGHVGGGGSHVGVEIIARTHARTHDFSWKFFFFLFGRVAISRSARLLTEFLHYFVKQPSEGRLYNILCNIINNTFACAHILIVSDLHGHLHIEKRGRSAWPLLLSNSRAAASCVKLFFSNFNI